MAQRTFKEWYELNKAFVIAFALPWLDDDGIFRLKGSMLGISIQEDDFG